MGKAKRVKKEREFHENELLASAKWTDIHGILVDCNGLVRTAAAGVAALVRHTQANNPEAIGVELTQQVIAASNTLRSIQGELGDLSAQVPTTDVPVTEETYPNFLARMMEADQLFTRITDEVVPTITHLTLTLCPTEEDENA